MIVPGGGLGREADVAVRAQPVEQLDDLIRLRCDRHRLEPSPDLAYGPMRERWQMALPAARLEQEAGLRGHPLGDIR